MFRPCAATLKGLEHTVQAACEKEFAPWIAHMHGHTQVYNFHINKEVPAFTQHIHAALTLRTGRSPSLRTT